MARRQRKIKRPEVFPDPVYGKRAGEQLSIS